MPLSTSELAQAALQVAQEVRRKVPRSANRFLEDGAGASDWLKNPNSIQYTTFMEFVVRAGTKGPGQTAIKQKTKVPGCFFAKTVYVDSSIKELKEAVLDFLNNGTVEGARVDLSYKPGMDAEKAYSGKFATALAAFLNARGLRFGQQAFEARSVLHKLYNELKENDRLIQSLGMSAGEAFNAIHGGPKADRELQFPPRYVAASGRNAIKFGTGNCEECGCAAFAMLLTFKKSDGNSLDARLLPTDNIRIELIQAKSAGDSHFFVLLNRPGTNDIFADFDSWFANRKVVASDPWITDTGAAGAITGFTDLRDYLKPMGSDGPEFLAVRATGNLGQTPENLDRKFDGFRVTG
jgi:hypothetical protein